MKYEIIIDDIYGGICDIFRLDFTETIIDWDSLSFPDGKKKQ